MTVPSVTAVTVCMCVSVETGFILQYGCYELRNLYSSPNIIRHIKSRRLRWPRHEACIGEETKVYNILVGKSERKRSLG
jgi:hypothetical protein